MTDFLIRQDHKKLEIKSKEKIIEFLSSQQTGRIASIDESGFPQIIPMNFVYHLRNLFLNGKHKSK